MDQIKRMNDASKSALGRNFFKEWFLKSVSTNNACALCVGGRRQ